MGTQRVGKAKITYHPTSSTGSTSTVNLGTPLFDIRPTWEKARFAADSVDLSTREVNTVGPGHATVDGRIRLHDSPQELLDMVDNARDGQKLTYYDTTGSTGIECWLVGGGDVEPDSDGAGHGWYEMRMTLRRTSTGGDDWSAVL